MSFIEKKGSSIEKKVSFIDGMKPDKDLVQTIKDAKAKQVEIQGLVKRLEDQRELVDGLSEKVVGMVTKKPWKKCLTVEDAQAARNELAELKDQLLEETEMLETIQLALVNTRRASQQVLSAPDLNIKRRFSAAAVKNEFKIRDNLTKAMDEFLVFSLARGSTNLLGAEEEMKMEARSYKRHMAASKFFNTAIKDLREQAYKAAG